MVASETTEGQKNPSLSDCVGIRYPSWSVFHRNSVFNHTSAERVRHCPYTTVSSTPSSNTHQCCSMQLSAGLLHCCLTQLKTMTFSTQHTSTSSRRTDEKKRLPLFPSFEITTLLSPHNSNG